MFLLLLKNCLSNCINRNKIRELENLNEIYVKRDKNISEKLKKYEEMEKIQLKTESNLKYAIENMAKNNENTMTYIEKLIRHGKEKGNEEKVVIQYTEESRNISCKVFYRNEILTPTDMSVNEKKLYLSSIIIENNTGKGIGSAVIRSLTNYLKDKKVEKIMAEISWVDYKNKDKLFNFYQNINGFKIVDENQNRILISKEIVQEN